VVKAVLQQAFCTETSWGWSLLFNNCYNIYPFYRASFCIKLLSVSHWPLLCEPQSQQQTKVYPSQHSYSISQNKFIHFHIIEFVCALEHPESRKSEHVVINSSLLMATPRHQQRMLLLFITSLVLSYATYLSFHGYSDETVTVYKHQINYVYKHIHPPTNCRGHIPQNPMSMVTLIKDYKHLTFHMQAFSTDTFPEDGMCLFFSHLHHFLHSLYA
jgi:hypothetical protein